VLRTKKVRNVVAGRAALALVVDDVLSIEPFVARGIRGCGVADPPVERIGMVGPGFHMGVTPTLDRLVSYIVAVFVAGGVSSS
jgi:pyridoxamine 5'-phosphate oxidase family protein